MFGTVHSIGVQEQIPIKYLYNWGRNTWYECGNGANSDLPVPTLIGTHAFWKTGSRGIAGAYIKSDGTLWVVGSNSNYITGLNTNAGNTTTLTQVGTDNKWKQVCVGGAHMIAVKHDGTLWSWGKSDYYQTGQNTTNAIRVPTQIGTDTDWKMCSTGWCACAAIKYNGTLWTWGQNGSTYLCAQNGVTANIQVPTQVGTDTDWVDVRMAIYTNKAVKRNGKLYSFGSNGSYEYGNNNTTQAQVPVQTTGITNSGWATNKGICTPWQAAAALKANGELYTWCDPVGNGVSGQGSNAYRIPTRLGSDYWKLARGMYVGMAAINTSGNLYTWGHGENYMTGLNSTSNVTTPQLCSSATDWYDLGQSQDSELGGVGFRRIPYKGEVWKGLQSYWSFETTGTTIYDKVGFRTLTASNVTWSASGKRGNCPVMNGSTSSLLTVGTDTYHNTDVATGSISMWIKVPLNTSNAMLFFSAEGWIELGADVNTGYPIGQSDGGVFDTFGTTSICDNNWHHLVYTWTASLGKLYIDGAAPIEKTQANAPTPDSSASRTSGIGCNWNGNYYYNGSIDEVAFWANKVLSASDVAVLYNSGNGLFY